METDALSTDTSEQEAHRTYLLYRQRTERQERVMEIPPSIITVSFLRTLVDALLDTPDEELPKSCVLNCCRFFYDHGATAEESVHHMSHLFLRLVELGVREITCIGCWADSDTAPTYLDVMVLCRSVCLCAPGYISTLSIKHFDLDSPDAVDHLIRASGYVEKLVLVGNISRVNRDGGWHCPGMYSNFPEKMEVFSEFDSLDFLVPWMQRYSGKPRLTDLQMHLRDEPQFEHVLQQVLVQHKSTIRSIRIASDVDYPILERPGILNELPHLSELAVPTWDSGLLHTRRVLETLMFGSALKVLDLHDAVIRQNGRERSATIGRLAEAIRDRGNIEELDLTGTPFCLDFALSLSGETICRKLRKLTLVRSTPEPGIPGIDVFDGDSFDSRIAPLFRNLITLDLTGTTVRIPAIVGILRTARSLEKLTLSESGLFLAASAENVRLMLRELAGHNLKHLDLSCTSMKCSTVRILLEFLASPEGQNIRDANLRCCDTFEPPGDWHVYGTLVQCLPRFSRGLRRLSVTTDGLLPAHRGFGFRDRQYEMLSALSRNPGLEYIDLPLTSPQVRQILNDFLISRSRYATCLCLKSTYEKMSRSGVENLFLDCMNEKCILDTHRYLLLKEFSGCLFRYGEM